MSAAESSFAPRILSVPAGVPFLAALVDALYGGRLVPGFRPDPADPMALADTVIYLPTRRAARALTALISERVGHRPILMPRIVPLGDVEDTEFDLAGLGEAETALSPALPEMERRLVLAGLILAWAKRLSQAVDADDALERPLLVPSSPADALSLAADMAVLMDEIGTQDVDWADLARAADERYDRYYGLTVEFLKIASQNWPALLAARGVADPGSRRDRLRRAEADRLRGAAPRGPVIAAGSTGTTPSTAALLHAIARLPMGAVVLPGLDPLIDAATLEAIRDDGEEHDAAHSHPQAAMIRLLDRMRLSPGDVEEIATPPETGLARDRFLTEAMRPSETTDVWASARLPDEAIRMALDGLSLVEAVDEREEALAAALALREALEDEGAVAALITPDRVLAERVCAELERWNIKAEDSAGRPLSRCRAGTFAALVAEAAAADADPVPLLALLHHPLTHLGLSRAVLDRARMALEIGVLRGPAPPAGFGGLRRALQSRRDEAKTGRHVPRPVRRLSDADWTVAADLLDRLEQVLGPLAQDGGPLDLVAFAARHRAACLAGALDDAGEERLFAGDDGAALAGLFDDLDGIEQAGVTGRLADYPAFISRLMAECAVRSAGLRHRRVKIWGLLEARLLTAERVVLGGLVETVWPPAAQTDAFLNRPMRGKLGLPSPEMRIGQTAHDLVQALGVTDAVMTRALKREGKPTVPSRFLQRMKAYAGEDAWQEVTTRGETYLAYARHLGTPDLEPPIPRPAPKPSAALQPMSLSVSEIETLVRDPYATYARHVLKLDPLEGLALEPGAADRGTIIHDAFAAFAKAYPDLAPEARLPRLLAIGREAFSAIADYPDVHALWWPRFERLAPHVVAFEETRRAFAARVEVETSGRLPITLIDGTVFTLRVRADRIEVKPDGAAVIDFKTGEPPSARQVGLGFAPQLTLEAEMLKRGAFEGLASPSADELLYMKAGGGDDPLKPKPVKPGKDDAWTVADLPARHMEGLVDMLNALRAGERGFTSRSLVEFARKAGPYDHLARVAEWSSLEGEGET